MAALIVDGALVKMPDMHEAAIMLYARWHVRASSITVQSIQYARQGSTAYYGTIYSKSRSALALMGLCCQ